ncbi:hypothetical protein [Micromonospora chokoriensis]
MEAIDSRLKAIPGLNTAVTEPGQITPLDAMAVVGLPRSLNYHQTMRRGFVDVDFPVSVMTSLTSDTSGQRELVPYLDVTGEKSILLAIEADKKLGGVVDDCIVREMEITGPVKYGQINYLSAVVILRVQARGNNS